MNPNCVCKLLVYDDVIEYMSQTCGMHSIIAIQEIFTNYKHPFAVTYRGASLMVIHLREAFIRDLCCKLWKKCASNCKNAEADSQDPLLYSPTIYKKMKIIQLESQPVLVRKDEDTNLSEEKAKLSIAKFERDVTKFERDVTVLKQTRKLTTSEIVAYGFLLAPLWFASELVIFCSTSFVAYTYSVLYFLYHGNPWFFTLFIAVFMHQNSLNVAKVAAVFVSMAGVLMTTLGKNWAADKSQFNTSGHGKRAFGGDVCGILSALAYSVFTVLLKKLSGEEGERIEVQKLFGYVGLFTLVPMWWLVRPLTASGTEPEFTVPRSARPEEIVFANGFIGSALSDYFWHQSPCVVWTTPLVATLGTSLTIPVAMVADILIHGRHYSAVYILGSVQVFAGFVIANLSDKITRILGL